MAMREAGLRMQHCELNGDPSYISFTPQLFRLACAIEALLDRPALRLARVHLIGVYQKPVSVSRRQETGDRRQGDKETRRQGDKRDKETYPPETRRQAAIGT